MLPYEEIHHGPEALELRWLRVYAVLPQWRFDGIVQAQKQIRTVTGNEDTDVEFVDGILFSKTSRVVVQGCMVSIPSSPSVQDRLSVKRDIRGST